MGYPHSENQWLLKDDLAKSKNLVDLFYKLYSEKPTEGKKRKAAKNSHLYYPDRPYLVCKRTSCVKSGGAFLGIFFTGFFTKFSKVTLYTQILRTKKQYKNS